MTTPTVIELPIGREPTTADSFLDAGVECIAATR
jgi:hypothetical protein